MKLTQTQIAKKWWKELPVTTKISHTYSVYEDKLRWDQLKVYQILNVWNWDRLY